jgi:hypothetical protein
MDLMEATLSDIAAELRRRPVKFALAVIEQTNWSAESGVFYSGTVGDALQLMGNGSSWLRYVNGLPPA